MASVSEVSDDWAGMFMITSESDSEVGSWGNSECSSLQEKSGGSGLLASFHGRGVGPWCVFSAILICVTSFQKSHKEFWRYLTCAIGLGWGSQ